MEFPMGPEMQRLSGIFSLESMNPGPWIKFKESTSLVRKTLFSISMNLCLVRERLHLYFHLNLAFSSVMNVGK